MSKQMERFMNGSEECIVLMRRGETALILRLNNTCQPYVVPLQHIEGESDWWQGRYFANLEDALKYYLDEDEADVDEYDSAIARIKETLDKAECSIGYIPRYQLYQALGMVKLAKLFFPDKAQELARMDGDICRKINNPKYFD